ncbi:MAG: DUF364 domain-containing protein [Dehalococcoidia bacterium]
MNIIDELISGLRVDSVVREVHTCVFWTAVVSKHCGLASTFRGEHPHHGRVRGVGELRNRSALELAEYAKSDNLLEASIGMATINSLVDIDETRCDAENALDVLVEKGNGKDIAVVGHFPWIPKLRKVARKLWVLELRPQAGDLPAEAAEDILPKADVVAITGTSLINHTAERLLELSKGSFIVMVGPTSPLSTVLFDWGVDVVSGVKVVEPDKAIRSISEGAIFPQVQGVKLLNMVKRGEL